MIRQHYLQQQRLNNNHDRLLQRFQHVLTPQLSEFRTLGRSPLPGRNYDQYVDTLSDDHGRRSSLVAQSRAAIGLSSETYRLMGEGANEILPRNISSIMQHTREQPSPLVLAEKKFQPVAFYEHPVFGRTPAYVRPVSDEALRQLDVNGTDSESDAEDEDDAPLRTSKSRASSIDGNHERKTSLSTAREADGDDDGDSDHAPLGFMSYKKWKAKYANLIPVNPLLYNIYTHRSHGSLDRYGHSLYAPRDPVRGLDHDDDVPTPTISEVDSILSNPSRGPPSMPNREYQRLQPQLFPKTSPSRPLAADSDGEISDDESSSRDSPVPYLSGTRTGPVRLTPLPTIRPSTPPTTALSSALNSSTNPAPGLPSAPLPSTSSLNLPPAPPMPASLLSGSTNNTYQTPSIVPPAPPLPPSLPPTTTNNTDQAPSHIPSAPPMPPSLSFATTNNTYQATSSAPPAPASTSTSAGIYQAPSSLSLPSIPKAVTFGGSSSFPLANNDVSSSSDSDDDDKQKRQQRKQKQAAAAGLPVDSSSDD